MEEPTPSEKWIGDTAKIAVESRIMHLLLAFVLLPLRQIMSGGIRLLLTISK